MVEGPLRTHESDLHPVTAPAATRNRFAASPRRRLASLLLALAIETLLILAFLTLNFRDPLDPGGSGERVTTFDVATERQDRSPSAEAQAEAQPQPERPVAPIPPPRVVLPPRPLDMIELTREEYAAADIAKLGRNAPGASDQLAGGSSPGDSERVGTGPGGQPLYAAEWYREPTNTELAAYLPKTMPEGGGWGLIACKTAERNRVTDCVELGNSPPGSRLAGAARQAAWQFMVRPPRVGGKPMIGEWVRIRIDYRVR
jgi:hypothetical protein